MKYCNKCKVNVSINGEKCPLCQSELSGAESGQNLAKFPKVKVRKKKFNFLIKLFILFFVVAVIVCAMVNYQLPNHGEWFRFVVFGVVTFCILSFIALKKYKNVLKCIFYETIIIACFIVFWDCYTGAHGWSLDWGVPIFFSTSLIAMGIIAKVMKITAEEHIVYLFSSAMFGIIPAILFFNGILSVKLPSMICMGISCILFCTVVLFEGQKMWSEFLRRFHM